MNKGVAMFSTVKAFVDAYSKRSLDECMACFASSPNVMAYGTNADEKRLGVAAIRDQLALDWGQMSSAGMDVTWHHEVQHGDVGWVAADIQIQFFGPQGADQASTRATFVLVRDDKKQWLIEHMHFSGPAELAVD